MSQRSLYKTHRIVLLIILLAIALRLYSLGKASFGYDEMVTTLYAENLKELFRTKVPVPPLYITMLHYWRVLGQSEFILRLLSVIFGIGSIIGIYFVGKLFFGTKTAIISSFILAISPLHIYYSQELTMYSLLAFLVLLAIYFFKKASESTGWLFWIGFAFFSTLSILTHYTAILILLSEIIFFLFFWRRYRHLFKRWALSHLLILIFLLPWLRVLILQLIFGIKIHVGWWVPYLPLKSLIITLKNFSIGYNVGTNLFFTASAVYFSLFILGIYSIKKRRDLILLLFILFIPLFCAFVLFRFNVKIYVDRYFLPGLVFYYLIVARGLSMLKSRYFSVSALIFMSVLNGLSLNNYYRNYLPNSYHHHLGVQKKLDFKSASFYIAGNFQKDDGIVHADASSVFPLEYYLNSRYYNDFENFRYYSRESRRRLWVKPWKNIGSSRITQYSLGDEIPKCRSVFMDRTGAIPGSKNVYEQHDISLRQYKRIWVVWVASLPKEHQRQRHKILKEMGGPYKKAVSKRFYGLKITLYEKYL